jgi:hypothetical protein
LDGLSKVGSGPADSTAAGQVPFNGEFINWPPVAREGGDRFVYIAAGTCGEGRSREPVQHAAALPVMLDQVGEYLFLLLRLLLSCGLRRGAG